MQFCELAFPIPVNQTYTYSIAEFSSAQVGFSAEASIGKKKDLGWIVDIHDRKPDFKLKPILRLVSDEALFGVELLDLAKWLSEFYLCSLGKALSLIVPSAKSKPVPKPEPLAELKPWEALQLNAEQQNALEQLSQKKSGLSYLYGITGSGKTEVYLQLAKLTLAQGRSVIYLVPEIALTHQLLEQLALRFQDEIAVLHSRLSPAQRLQEWYRIKESKASFVVGARSAIFAPINNLGLIIVDEEHESSYKSGSTPRYHARQVAMFRAKQSNALLLMGSATPSLEAWHLIQNGSIQRLELTKRARGEGARPKIDLVDLRKSANILAPPTIEALAECKAAGGQSIILMNRRGFAHSLHCFNCERVIFCPNCSVSLTYHKNKDKLICHHCNYSSPRLRKCPNCNSFDIGFTGFGTQQLEESLQHNFPALSIQRLDTDIASKKGAVANILTDLARGNIDILLGTQMIAKGLNFEKVKLVCIALADLTMNMPDFRGAEQAFSLMLQVAGRSGRFSSDGRVLIQTYQPHSSLLKAVLDYDLQAFYQRELEIRKLTKFPPFKRLLRLVFRGGNEERVWNEAAKWSKKLKSTYWDLLGPVECPLAKIAGNYRVHILLRCHKFNEAHRELSRIYNETANTTIYVEVDIDPNSLM